MIYLGYSSLWFLLFQQTWRDWSLKEAAGSGFAREQSRCLCENECNTHKEWWWYIQCCGRGQTEGGGGWNVSSGMYKCECVWGSGCLWEWVFVLEYVCTYCKSTNFGVLLYLANLVNCVFSLIFVAANIYVDRTLHRRAAGRRQITLFWETPNFIAAKICWFTVINKFWRLQNLAFLKIKWFGSY